MKKFNKQKRSFYAAASALMLVALFTFFPLAGAPLKNTSADSVPSLSISSLGNISLRIRANSNGSLAIVKDTITANTTNDNGYQLYLSAAPNTIYRAGYNASTASTKDKIQPIAATFTAPKTLSLSNNVYGSWGFALEGGNFSSSYSTTTPSLSSKFAQVPNYTADGFNSQLIHSSSTQSVNDTTDVYYGVMANTELNNGSYTTTLLYTALAEVSSGVPGSHSTVTVPTEDLIYNEYGDDQVITITTDLITTENIGEAKVNLIGKGTGDIVPCKNVRIISQSPVTVACNIPANLNPDDYDIEIIIPQIGKTYTIPSALQIKIAYTIYYNANDGTNAPADSTVNYPSSSYNMELSDSIPTRSGYKFLGWSENPNDTVATYKWYGGGPTPDGNMSWRPFNPNTVALTKERPTRKLYAIWENNGNYVVSYSANGGSNAPAQFSTPIDSQEYSVTINTTTIPTNNGLGFAGYAESSTAETPTYIYNSVTNSFTPSVVSLYSDSKKSTVLYAIWETIDYSVSYVANGGSNIPSSESYSLKVASKDITINTSKIPFRTNHQFLGYAESATGDVVYAYNANSRTFTPSSFTLTMANPNKILYAVFIEIFTHSVSYSANGASVPSSRTITTTALTSSISVDASVIPSKTSSNFLGYAESSTATTPDYVYNSANNTFTPADVTFGSTSTAKTLYAVFQDVYIYTINYYADQGTNVPESTVINTTDTSRNVNISTSIPSRTGHKFLGWDENPNATTPTYAYSSNTFSPAAVAFTTQKRTYNLYAIWAEYNSFSLSYDLNYNAGASATVPPAEEEADTTAASKTYSINTTVIPTRSGYQFLGYATSNTASVPTYTYSSNTFTPNSITLTKTNNIVVLYAVWAKTYSLSYNANSGSGVPSSASAQATDASYSFTISNATIPTRSGYKFLGYDTSSTATAPTYVYNSSNNSFTPASITLTESAASKTLYAIWAKIYTYTLSYNANQGSNVPNAKTYSGTETAHEFPIWATGDPIPTRSL